jgi:type VI secretion system protein ImpM
LAWQFQEADGDGDADELNVALLSHLLMHRDADASVWWTAGSERVAGCTLFVSGLPSEPAFRAMLDGGFESNEWSSGVLHRTAAKPAMVSTGWRTTSAARSDAGKVRPLNEDSFACRDEAGIWIVADGLGGHRAGEVASRMVASIVNDATASGTLQEHVETLRRGAQVVNGCLRVFAEGVEAATVASTMVALVIVESRAAALWAGDSRVYRLRAGRLEQLTRDHAEEDSAGSILSGGGPHNRAVTRAVGGAAELDIDAVYETVYPDDRYLLCTDGLYTMVGEAEIARALSLSSVEQACDELARLALDSAANDNITAVVVHVTHLPNDVGAE